MLEEPVMWRPCVLPFEKLGQQLGQVLVIKKRRSDGVKNETSPFMVQHTKRLFCIYVHFVRRC